MEHASLKPESNRKRNTARSKAVIQTQLETTVPGDAWEQEADRAADMVTGRYGQKASVNQGGVPAISAYGGTPVAISSKMESQFNALQGGGMSMPDGLKSQMQQGFGRDFSDVRIHTGNESAQMNASLGSRAFTHGNDIYFNEGQYQPNTAEGQHLIAHELAHTLQQSGKVARETAEPEQAESDTAAEVEEVIGYFSTALGLIGAITELISDASYFRTAVRELPAIEKMLHSTQEALIMSMAYYNKSFGKARAEISRFRIQNANYDKIIRNAAAKESAKEVGKLGKAAKFAKTGFDFISYAIQVVDWCQKTYHAFNIAINLKFNGSSIVELSYTILRMMTCVADIPIPVYPPHIVAVLKAWNTGSAIGDIIDLIEQESGYYDKYVLPRQKLAAEAMGGVGTTSGDIGALIAAMPVVGDVATYRLNAIKTLQSSAPVGEKIVAAATLIPQYGYFVHSADKTFDIAGDIASSIYDKVEDAAYDAYSDTINMITIPF